MESFHHNSKSRSGYSTGYLKTPAETSNSSISPYERYIRTRTLMRAYRRKRQELQVYYRGIATAKMADGNISYIVFDTIKRHHTPSQRQELAKYLFNFYGNSREGHCRILRERRCTPPMAIFFVQPFATATNRALFAILLRQQLYTTSNSSKITGISSVNSYPSALPSA
jgi:hypothetical protein